MSIPSTKSTSILKPLDTIGDWLAKILTPQHQRRVGVLMCMSAFPLFIYGFFTKEPFLIYQMSAMAMELTGISTVIAAVTTEED